MAALLLLLNGLDTPFHSGVGGLQPVAMERSLRIIDEALGAVDAQVQLPVRRTREAGVGVTTAGAGRNRVELVATVLLAVATVATAWSGYQSTRWNGEQAKAGGARERAADRVGQGGGAREHPDGDRRGDLHAVGQRLRAEPDGARGLLLQALPRGVQARRRRLDRDEAAQEPERAADTVRDAAVQARGARGGRAARRGGRGLRRAGARGTSSAHRTTCWVSSCSRRRCSSQA